MLYTQSQGQLDEAFSMACIYDELSSLASFVFPVSALCAASAVRPHVQARAPISAIPQQIASCQQSGCVGWWRPLRLVYLAVFRIGSDRFGLVTLPTLTAHRGRFRESPLTAHRGRFRESPLTAHRGRF